MARLRSFRFPVSRVNSTLDRAVSAQRGGSGGLTPLPSLRVMAWGPPSPPLADPSPLENGRDDFLVLLSRPQRARVPDCLTAS
jgi:hypothetical protein